MIPLTFLYDEFIDRPKLSEQKKPFEYIVPPPTSGVGTTIYCLHLIFYKFGTKFVKSAEAHKMLILVVLLILAK